MENKKNLSLLALAVALVFGSIEFVTAASFTAFESGQVRPLALSPDGSRLFAVNTPDRRLPSGDIASHDRPTFGAW